MKKILDKSFTGLLIILCFLFLIIIRIDATNKPLVYGLGLLLMGILVIILPYLLNNSKKINVRRFYLLSITFIGIFLILESIYFLVFYFTKVELETLNIVFIWLIRFAQAFFICFSIFTLFYALKDFFKKEYEFQKLDLQSFTMILNLLSGIIFIYLYFYNSLTINARFDNLTFNFVGYEFIFSDYHFLLNGAIVTSLIYIILYVVIELIKYYKFEKNRNGD